MSHHYNAYGASEYPTMGATPTDQGQGHPGAQPGWPPHPYAYPEQYAVPASSSILPRDRFMKGLLIGAAATYLLTNEQVQRTAIKGVVKAWSLLQGGIEEVKERFGDAEAELRHATPKKDG